MALRYLILFIVWPVVSHGAISWCPTKIRPDDTSLESALAIQFANYFAKSNADFFQRNDEFLPPMLVDLKIAKELECKYFGPDVWLKPIKSAIKGRYNHEKRKALLDLVSGDDYVYDRNTDTIFLDWAASAIDFVFNQYHFNYSEYEKLKAALYDRELPNFPAYRKRQFVLKSCDQVYTVSAQITNPIAKKEFNICGNGVRSVADLAGTKFDYKFENNKYGMLFIGSIEEDGKKSVYVDSFPANQPLRAARCIGNCERTLQISIARKKDSNLQFSIAASNLNVAELGTMLALLSPYPLVNIDALDTKAMASFYFEAIPLSSLVEVLADAGNAKVRRDKSKWVFQRKD